MKHRWLAATAMFLATAPAFAQETICDPENPACVPAHQTAPIEAVGDSETICDPENPACVAEQRDETVILEQAVDQTPNAFETAQFLGAWGTRLDVDSAFDATDEDIVELSSYLNLGLKWEASDSLRVVLSGQFRHWVGGKENTENTDLLLNAQDVRASYDARLGEAYVVWRNGGLGVALGNLVTRWGSTDLTRPGDVLNPTDQTTFSAQEAAERLPQLTLDLSYSGNGWSIQGLVVPFFVADKVWAFGRDTSLLNSRNPVVAEQFPIDGLLEGLIDPSTADDIQPIIGASRVPDEVPNNLSLGLRATGTVWNTDLGVGVWRGWDRTPFIFVDDDMRALLGTLLTDGQVLEDLDFLQFFVRHPELLDITESLSTKAAAGQEVFFSEYRRQHMLLIDGARYIGPVGVRFDAAFFPQKTYMTEGFRAVRRPTLAPSLGLSWERLKSEDDAITVTVEGFLQKPFGADDGITKAFVGEDLRGGTEDPLLIIEDHLYGIAGAFVWAVPWIETQFQLGGVYNISHGDWIASASASRTLFDWLKLTAGYTMFEGPEPAERLTLGGLYDANDQFSLGASGVF